MAKRVLVIEQSLAVRGVAESLLRQNGFDVVSADSPSGAMEILGTSKIDLILVSSEITVESGQPLYEHIGADKSAAAVPILILHDPNSGPEPGYPPESIIAKPFTPRDFLATIGPFVGSEETVTTSDPTPFSGADFEDALIDSALGLDKIEVDDAEIMEDDTGIYRRQNRKGVTESMIGFDLKVNPDDTTKAIRGKIESMKVPAEAEETPETPPDEKPADSAPQDDSGEEIPDKGLNESSEIEIITDQYGITSIPEAADLIRADDDDKAHDYEWFLSELRREASGEKKPEPVGETPMGPQVSLDGKPPKASRPPKPKTPPEKKAKAKESPKE
jgi:CheY-like chemotaxis protein